MKPTLIKALVDTHECFKRYEPKNKEFLNSLHEDLSTESIIFLNEFINGITDSHVLFTFLYMLSIFLMREAEGVDEITRQLKQADKKMFDGYEDFIELVLDKEDRAILDTLFLADPHFNYKTMFRYWVAKLVSSKKVSTYDIGWGCSAN